MGHIIHPSVCIVSAMTLIRANIVLTYMTGSNCQFVMKSLRLMHIGCVRLSSSERSFCPRLYTVILKDRYRSTLNDDNIEYTRISPDVTPDMPHQMS